MESLQSKIICFLEENFDLNNMDIPDEYRYQSLPLCLIDAIFSIGVTYTSTANTVKKYCDKFQFKEIRDGIDFPPISEQETITQFLESIREYGIDNFAENINKQRTSSKNGILKIEAVVEWAEILQKHNIETLQDFSEKLDISIEKQLLNVKGQGSGISLAYLKMLCGDSNTLKPDRHILRFLNYISGKIIDAKEAQKIVSNVVIELSQKYEDISVRAIDYKIWEYMKTKDNVKTYC